MTSAAKAAVRYQPVYGTAEAVPLSRADVVARHVDVVAAQRGNTGVVRSAQDDNFGREAGPVNNTDVLARGASAAEAVRKTDVVARRVDVVAAQRGNTGVLPLRVAQGQDDNFEESGRGGMAPEVVQTVATARQVTADGRVWVTRMVVVRAYDVSAADAGRSVSDVPMAEAQPVGTVQQQSKQQQVRPYAAVPVQGGWLVFQL
jgi:hypothetical protein